MIILLDMDGVIANFVQGLIDSHGWAIDHDDYAHWNYHETFGLTDEEMWEATHVDDWWLNLKPYAHASEIVAVCREFGDVVFCTSPGLDARCASEKVSWLRKHGLMSHRRNDFQIGPRKELLAGSGGILIDDNDRNVTKFAGQNGRAILFPRPWNVLRGFTGNHVEYVKSGLSNLAAMA